MSRSAWRVLSVAVDAVAINAAVLLAFLLRFGWPPPQENFVAYQRLVIPLTILQLLIFFMVDLYDPMTSRSGPELLGTLVKGVLLGTLVLVALTFFLRAFSFPRSVIGLLFVLQIVFLWGWRRLASALLHVHWPERRVVLVGSSRDALTVAERLKDLAGWGYRLVGVVSDESAPEWAPAGVAWLPPGGDVSGRLEELRADQIIVTTPAQHREILEEISLSHRFEGDIYVIPQLYEIHLGEVNFSLLHDVPLLRLTRPARPPWQQGAKVVVERIAAAVLLVLLVPLLLLVALAVLLFSGRPVLYLQERLGKDMVPFTLYKFRTMVPDAEVAVGPVLAREEDPRITSVGRWLRASRLDELIQLLNVARGEMSFVGPRPERAAFVQEFLAADPLYAERFRIRPGITGLAQVSGSYATTAAVKLRFDLMYVYHQSFGLDLRILARTVQVVLTGRGAL